MVDRTNPVPRRAVAGAVLAILTGTALAGLLALVERHPASGSPAQEAILLSATLLGSAEVPPVTTAASGEAVLVLDPDGETLRYVVTVKDIQNITAAHLHLAAEGVNGPPFAFLFDATGTNGPDGPFDSDHPISGTLMLSSTHALALMAGGVYVNVHTATQADGQIRGQVGPYDAPERTFTIGLGGDQEVPPVASELTGIATFTLGAGDDSLALGYALHVAGAVSGTIGAAHLHRGERGENGAPFAFLYDATGANGPDGPFDDAHPISGMLALTPEQLLLVLSGSTYANVHTTAHAAGEIRGQLETRGTPLPGQELGLFRAAMTGAQEVPPVTTSASGEAVMAFDDDGVSVHYVVSVAAIANITAAHLHTGVAGVSGPPIVTLYDVTGVGGPGGPFGPGIPLRGTVTLSMAQAAMFRAGGLYLNVHTTEHAAGEIRGQVLLHAAGALTTTLSGAEEVPPVETAATGHLRIGPSGTEGMLSYRLAVTDIVSVTASHLHRGRRGTNGPVAVWLFDPSGIQAPGGVLAPGDPITGEVAVSALLLVDLYGGNLYANVHTAAHIAGEIRGQVAGGAEVPEQPTATPTPTATATVGTPTGTETAGTPGTPTPTEMPGTPGTPTETATPGTPTPTETETPGTPGTPPTPTATSESLVTPTDGTPGTATATGTAGTPGTPMPSATPTGGVGVTARIYLSFLIRSNR